MPDGNSEQIRHVAEAVAKATIAEYGRLHPDAPKEAPVPPLVKWLVGAIAAFGSAALIGLGFWLVTSVSNMRETLAVINERMMGQDTAQVARDEEQDRRIRGLEAYHDNRSES